MTAVSGSHETQQPAKRSVYSLAIELTGACNQKCDYCYNSWRDDGGRSLNTGDSAVLLARVSKLLSAWQLDHVTLTGGEPISHPGLFPLLDLLKANGVRAQMISNGGLINDKLAEQLAQYNLRFVQVTLNGDTRELHEDHVGEGHFERTLRGIRALVAAGVPVAGCIVVTRKNAHAVGEILALWQALGVTNIALSRFSPAGYAASFAAQLLPSRADMIRAFEAAQPYARDSGMTITCTMPIPPCSIEIERYAPIGFGVCAVGTGFQEFALSPEGKLRNCTLHHTAIGGVADILSDDVDVRALLEAVEVTEYKRHTPEFCRGCQHETTCGGGCGAAAEWVLGSRRFVDPFVAQYVEEDFQTQLAKLRGDGRKRLEVIVG
jgi:pyrroloquinoline quinone biosynthesis protein E